MYIFHQLFRHTVFNSLRPKQNGRHFGDDIFRRVFLNVNIWIPIKISLKFVPNGSINNIPALVQIMAWSRPGDKTLSEPMMVNLPTHICVTRPQWGKSLLWTVLIIVQSCLAILQIIAIIVKFVFLCIVMSLKNSHTSHTVPNAGKHAWKLIGPQCHKFHPIEILMYLRWSAGPIKCLHFEWGMRALTCLYQAIFQSERNHHWFKKTVLVNYIKETINVPKDVYYGWICLIFS